MNFYDWLQGYCGSKLRYGGFQTYLGVECASRFDLFADMEVCWEAGGAGGADFEAVACWLGYTDHLGRSEALGYINGAVSDMYAAFLAGGLADAR